MLAGIGDAFVHGVADIGPVFEQLVEHALVDCLAVSIADVLLPEFMGQKGRRLEDQKSLEDGADGRGVRRVDDQLAVLDLVAERRPAAHPDALLAGGGDLVPDPLADHLALELGKGHQMFRVQPPISVGGVERLGDRDERGLMALEQLDQLGKVDASTGTADRSCRRRRRRSCRPRRRPTAA